MTGLGDKVRALRLGHYVPSDDPSSDPGWHDAYDIRDVLDEALDDTEAGKATQG